MAKPQTENGYTKMANELLEGLSRINLSPYEWRVFMCILRKTYGWNKKSDYISVSQISEGTGLPRSHACRAKRSLLEKKLLIENNGLLGPNKDYDTWNVINSGNVTGTGNKSAIKRQKQRNVTSTGTVPKLVTSVTGTGNKTLPAEALQKKRKKLSQKTRSSSVSKKAIESSNNGKLFEQFWTEYPRKVGKQKCRQIWKRLKPSAELAEQIITKVKAYKRTDQWQKDNGEFIPHPQTFLNGKRWEDEIITKPEPQRGDPDWLPTEAEVDELFRQTGLTK